MTVPSSAALAMAIEHCERMYPAEGCGVIVEVGGAWQTRVMANAASETSKTEYRFRPEEQLALFEELDRDRGRLAFIFHSHPDRPATLSWRDRQHAEVGGEPTLPGVAYLVLGVHLGVARELQVFTLSDRRWGAERLELPPRVD